MASGNSKTPEFLVDLTFDGRVEVWCPQCWRIAYGMHSPNNVPTESHRTHLRKSHPDGSVRCNRYQRVFAL